MKWTLRKRIALPFIIVLLTSIGSVGSISLYLANQTLSGLLDAQLEAQSRTARQAIDDAMSRLRSSLVELSADADTRLALDEGGIALEARERLIARLEILDDTNAEGERFTLLAVDGAMVASSLVDDGDTTVFAKDAAFQKALSGSPALSAPFLDTNQRPIVVLFVPVQDDATTRGVLATVVPLASLTARILDPIKVLDTGYAYLCDATGLVIGHPDKAQILKTQIANYDWGREILRTSEGQIRYTYAGVSKLAVFSACESLGWRVTVTAPDDEIYAPARRIGAAILATGVTVILLGMGLAWLTARWIGGVLADLTRRLAAGASETRGAAAHVSESSQSLSQGASEEAAALQQTSATLEELSATIRQNTADTQKAKELARGANASAEQGSQNMRDMEAALRRIDAAGTAIAKILKSIDEIAFQTNILALNAAVEAARAGEAGAGFAVVADEVRSLAQRSAQAAKETAELVEHVVKSTGEGVADGAKVARSLTEIHANVQRLDRLVIQVATASAEQDRGISQLQLGVAQLDKVTQGNAATAEESAASAEELNSQAGTLHHMVEELEALVGDTERRRARPSAAAQSWDTPPSNLATRASTGANGGNRLAGVSRNKYAVAETSSLR